MIIRGHHLKIQKCFLEALVSLRKKYEIRFNDRDYQTGDVLYFKNEVLWEGFDSMPGEVVGKSIRFEITHVLNYSQFPEGLKENYVILSLKEIK